MENEKTSYEQRVLVFAPLGRDAMLTCKILAEEGITGHACRTMDEFCNGLLTGAGAAFVTEEALSEPGLERLISTLEKQELWSDLPLILFTSSKDRARFFLETVGARLNLTILERPINIAIVVSAVRAALRARRRQYQLRDALAALEKQQRWLEDVLNLAPVPMLLVEPGTARVTFANHAADKMAGGDYPKGVPAAAYHTAYTCTKADGSPIPNDEMPGVRVARGERLEGFQMDWHTADGIRSLLLHADTIPAATGHPSTCVVMFQDITHLKQIEASLRSANRAKDEFLATVSHELRTPLNAMLGWVKMLRSGVLSEADADHALEVFERNARSQAQLIDDLLDVSRIITGKLRLELRPVDLVAVVRAAVDVVRPAAAAKSVRLHVSIDAETEGPDGVVSGDADRLQQVVWNLLSNAVKFTPKGGDVRVEMQRVNGHAEVTVSDNGQGISAEFLPFVFDRFRQADGSLSRKHGGMGLGLAIVRHLVELHGGSVSAASPGPGQGAVFKVSLPPRSVGPADTPATGVSTAGEETDVWAGTEQPFTYPPVLRGYRLLVVEDEADALDMVGRMLDRCKAEVRRASSAAEALDLLKEWKPDVVVSDIEMPGEDGYSLIRKIRSGGNGRSRVPAVALTAHARAEDRIQALAAGFDAHVAKPIEPQELITVIASLAQRKQV